jgi:hypothetical protein
VKLKYGVKAWTALKLLRMGSRLKGIRVPVTAGNFLARCGILSYSVRTLIY